MTTLYRKRLIPDECICLKDDSIIMNDSQTMLTTWKTLHPKADFASGISYYVIDQGWKISRFYAADGSLVYTYCDIIDTEYIADRDEYIFTDLLADVIIENDGSIKVLDLDELADACSKHILSNDMLSITLHRLDALLTIIYNGEFYKYINIIQKNEPTF